MKNVVRLRPGSTRRHRFEELMAPHFEPLYKAARRMTLSPCDAEDLVQDVCLKAFDSLDELENIEFLRAWLLKVMYHQFVDGVRRDGRSPIRNAATGQDSDEPDALTSADALPDEAVDRLQNVERVLQAMQRLDPDLCAHVAMHDVEGVTIAELSAMTGMPAGTIKAQLHRTRKKLGRLLSNDAVGKPHLNVVGGRQ